MLEDLRNRIDICDAELKRLFRERLKIVGEVAQYKKERALPIYDPKREAEILSRYEGAEREFFSTLLRLSRKEQSNILFPYNLVLVGFMGVGKTSVGAILAEHLGREFVDLDKLLEARLGVSIADYFASQGEVAFRAQERALIQEIASQEEIVLATGGGAVLDPSNVSALRQQGRLVLLTATAETITARLKDDCSRPVLGGMADLGKIQELLEQRKPLYQDAAQLTIATDDLAPEAVAGQIVQSLLKLENELAGLK